MLRHAESVSNADSELAALPDAEGDRLTERCREQALSAAEVLPRRGVTKVLTSPLGRAVETALPIGERLGLAPIVLDYAHELRESVGYGLLDAEQQRLRRWSERMHKHRHDPDHSVEGSESFNEVLTRVRRLKAELEELGAGQVPLLVSHGILLRFFMFDSILGDAFGPALTRRMWHLRTVNCGLSVFECGERWHPADPETPGWTCLGWMEPL
jgi:broad specificity phosphatase PhoE